MSGLLIGGAVLVVLAAMGVRAALAARARRARTRFVAARTGYCADRPLEVEDFREIDDFVELARCPCGGLLDRLGEGGRPGLRVVRCACLTCEEDVDLFFELTGSRH